MSMIGFALSGGGSKISFHLGALQVLMDEHSIQPDIVSGTSAGALAGLTAAAGRLDLLKAELDDIQGFADVYGGTERGFAWRVLRWKLGWGDPPRGLHNMDPLRRRIERVVRTIGQLRSVFYPVRVEFETGNIEIQTTIGRAVLDVLASASIPVFTAPVRRNGSQWVDGGVREFSPVSSVVSRHDVDRLYVLNTQRLDTSRRTEVPSFVEGIQQTIDITSTEIFRNDLRRLLDWNHFAEEAQQWGHTHTHPRKGRPVETIDTVVIEPSEGLPAGTNFGREALNRGVRLGREAARTALSS